MSEKWERLSFVYFKYIVVAGMIVEKIPFYIKEKKFCPSDFR